MILSHVIRDSHREEGAVDIVVEDGVITGIFPAGTATPADHRVIDLDGFAALPNQILAVPQWTYQKGGSVDGTNLGMQKADSETFIKQCVTTM